MPHPVFLEGHYDTGFVEEHMNGGLGEREDSGDERRVALMLAAIAAYRRDKAKAERASLATPGGGGDRDPWMTFGRRQQMRSGLR
jgi:hypothetical protein